VALADELVDRLLGAPRGPPHLLPPHHREGDRRLGLGRVELHDTSSDELPFCVKSARGRQKDGEWEGVGHGSR
jgi:hypothetical protein